MPTLPSTLGLLRRGAKFIVSTFTQESCRSCNKYITSSLETARSNEAYTMPALLPGGQNEVTTSDALCHPCFVAIASKPPLLAFLNIDQRENGTMVPVASGIAYCGCIVELIHRFKFEEDLLLTPDLTNLMLNGWSVLSNFVAGESAILVPVPLHWRRRLQRGYNQAEVLAREAAKHIGAPVEPGALKRTKVTPPQHTLGKEERSRNLIGVFKGSRTLLEGRTVVLIDDICTSGATLTACAQAAYAAGARNVTALTIARTPLFQSPESKLQER